MENLTPMLKQYQQIKSEYQDYILFFRLGDFYEMFFEDAKVASTILGVVLTSRTAGKDRRIPMCGIPYHAAENYIAKLINNGFKVAICEQVEDPKTAKGIVQRKVVKTITPGTFIDDDGPQRNLLACLTTEKDNLLLSLLDITTGIIELTSFPRKESLEQILNSDIKEIIYPENNKTLNQLLTNPLIESKKITLSPYPDWKFNSALSYQSLPVHISDSYIEQLGLSSSFIDNISALLSYAKETIKEDLSHINQIRLLHNKETMYIQPSAMVGLGIEELIKVLDNTKTAMGSRTLRKWIKSPLTDIHKIKQRQTAIKLIAEKLSFFMQIAQQLSTITDIEKQLSRIACGYQKAKDIINLRNNLSRIREIKREFSDLLDEHPLFTLQLPEELTDLLEKAIVEDLPQKLEGNLIKEGFSEEIDKLRNIQRKAESYLKELQAREIKRTGIQSLKIGYNKVFGYYIEVTKANLKFVPKDYIRKQTLVNAERFVTEELKNFEEEILTAEEKLIEKEKEILSSLKEEILKNSHKIYKLSQQIGILDVLISSATIFENNNYCVPELTDDFLIEIKNGRHPIVEKNCNDFIPNDVLIDRENNSFLIITGPNMAGKSTFIRQVGLIVIMAQTGLPVPAQSASIGVVDRLFARIGAQDEIFKGQSTFMVEMSQTAGILNNITEHSLVILDEIGRGTSTYDGMSIAWAVSEFLAKRKIRTLFATHFHELIDLEEELPNVKNYNIAVKEWNGEIIFLHRIVKGGCDQSYGIYVAKIAGLPAPVIQRAKEILHMLETRSREIVSKKISSINETQLPLFTDPITKIIQEIKETDINNMTGLEALNKINQWKQIIG